MAVPVFRDYALEVLDLREKEGVRGIVSERSRFHLHLWKAPFAKLSLEAIRPKDIRDWLGIMQAKYAHDTRGRRLITTQTVARAKALVSAILARAVEQEIVEINVCQGVRLRKRADEMKAHEPWTYLTLEEQETFWTCEEIDYEDRLAIDFACRTGLRQGEQFNLELRDVHVTGSPHVFVRFGSKGKPPKNGKARKVPLDGRALSVTKATMEFYKDKPNPHGLLFPSDTGERRGVGKPLGRKKVDGRWDEAWKHAKRAVGLTRRVRWHDLRHTCASNLVSGVLGKQLPLEMVQKMLGHSSITITQRYAHLGDDVLAAAMRDIAA